MAIPFIPKATTIMRLLDILAMQQTRLLENSSNVETKPSMIKQYESRVQWRKQVVGGSTCVL